MRFSTLPGALADLLRQESLPATEQRLRRYTFPDLLILDELGYVPCDSRAALLSTATPSTSTPTPGDTRRRSNALAPKRALRPTNPDSHIGCRGERKRRRAARRRISAVFRQRQTNEAQSGMRFSARSLRAMCRLAALSVLTVGAYGALLFAPGPLFRYAHAATAVTVHSDAPLPTETAEVVRRTEGRVQRSPLFDAAIKHDVYFCNSSWRWWFLSSGNHKAAAIALLAPFGRAVITREAHVVSDRLVQASGKEGPNERTLDYFIAHEITHTMTADFLGARSYLALPVWVREGYADYVGRASDFDYEDARAALVGGTRMR